MKGMESGEWGARAGERAPDAELDCARIVLVRSLRSNSSDLELIRDDLSALGARVVLVEESDEALRQIDSIDAQVILVDSSGDPGAVMRVGALIHPIPRLRFARVHPLRWVQTAETRRVLDSAAVLSAIELEVGVDRSVRRLSRDRSLFAVPFTRLGPTRTLQAMSASQHGVLRLTVHSPAGRAVVELTGEMIVSAGWHVGPDPAPQLVGLRALGAFLELREGHAQVDRHTTARVMTIMQPLSVALGLAQAAHVEFGDTDRLQPRFHARRDLPFVETSDEAYAETSELSPNDETRMEGRTPRAKVTGSHFTFPIPSDIPTDTIRSGPGEEITREILDETLLESVDGQSVEIATPSPSRTLRGIGAADLPPAHPFPLHAAQPLPIERRPLPPAEARPLYVPAPRPRFESFTRLKPEVAPPPVWAAPLPTDPPPAERPILDFSDETDDWHHPHLDLASAQHAVRAEVARPAQTGSRFRHGWTVLLGLSMVGVFGLGWLATDLWMNAHRQGVQVRVRPLAASARSQQHTPVALPAPSTQPHANPSPEAAPTAVGVAPTPPTTPEVTHPDFEPGQVPPGRDREHSDQLLAAARAAGTRAEQHELLWQAAVACRANPHVAIALAELYFAEGNHDLAALWANHAVRLRRNRPAYRQLLQRIERARRS